MKIRVLVGILASCVAVILVQPAHGQPALDRLEGALDRILAPGDSDRPAREPGYLGLFADDAPDGARGVQITAVNKGGPAEASNLRAGDIISAIERKRISNMDDLATAMRGKAAGEKIEFEVIRFGRPQTIVVTLGRRPPSAAGRDDAGDARSDRLIVDPFAPTAPPSSGRPALGVNVRDVTEEERRKYGLTVRRGALVSFVSPGSPAQRGGLTVGAVIVAVDGRRVDSKAELVDLLRSARIGQDVEITYYQRDQLRRTTLRLAAAPVAAVPVPPSAPVPDRTAESPLDLRPPARVFGEDRPNLRKVEDIIDRFIPSPAPPPPAHEDRGDVESLKRQIQLLQRQVEQLQRRVSELEAGRDTE